MRELNSIPAHNPPVLKMRGICKQFPGVLANDRVDLDIYSSEIHALLGENGAGKSTLMKILYGFYRPNSGNVEMEGREVLIKTPADARRLKIGMVFQVLNLIPAMTVLENIALFLNDLPTVYQPSRIRTQLLEYSRQYGLEIHPDEKVARLSIGEQQKVEILKLLLSGARILILDEPTRVLAPHEVEGLFQVLNRLKEAGFAILLITHKLREVLECADRITVLRAGRVAGSILRAEANEAGLIQMMFGRQMGSQITREPVQHTGKPILELKSLCTRAEGSAVSLMDVDLKVFPGEILGVAGVSGNGQKELCDAILGLEKMVSGEKWLGTLDISRQSPGNVRKCGVGFIPENPHTMATVPFMSVIENMAITRTSQYATHGGLGLDWMAVKADTHQSLERYGFNFSDYMPVKALSGGNLQRLIIAREMMNSPRLIIASYLTRGLDVHSALVARQELMRARNAGAGVLLISEDMEELFSLSDRLIVLYEGRVVGEFRPDETNSYEIGLLMTGVKREGS